ncbi:hypothetical protein D3C72_2134660 [compost metagenome]
MPTSRYSALSASCGCDPGLMVSTGSLRSCCTVSVSSSPAGPTQPISMGRQAVLMMPASFIRSVCKAISSVPSRNPRCRARVVSEVSCTSMPG